MFFKNPAAGVIPNFPVVHAIHEMHRRVAELNGELKAAGCTVVENFGEMLIEVPASAAQKVDAIMQRHVDMFNGPVVSRSGTLQIGDEDAEAEI